MVDWDVLRGHMPQIVEQLLDMMTEDALPDLINGPLSDVQMWPAVEIGYTTRSGERFKVRLSIEQDAPETECQR